MKKLSVSSLMLLAGLALSASFFIYILARSDFFSAPKYVDVPFSYYVQLYVRCFLMVGTPLISIVASLVIAPRSTFVSVFTGATIVITGYFTYVAAFEARGVDVVGVLLFMNLLIFWVCGLVLILTAVIMARKTVAPSHKSPTHRSSGTPQKRGAP